MAEAMHKSYYKLLFLIFNIIFMISNYYLFYNAVAVFFYLYYNVFKFYLTIVYVLSFRFYFLG